MKGTIEQRSAESFRIRIYLGREKVDGKWKKIYHTEIFHGKQKGAEIRRAQLLTQFAGGELVQSSGITLDEYLDRWLSDALKNSVAPRTYSDYSQILDRYVRAKLGKIKLNKLTALNVQAVYTGLREREQPLSARTIRYLHDVLNKALNQAVKWGFLSRNVAKLTTPPVYKGSAEMKVLTQAETAKFLSYARGTRFYALFVLALDTGLRPEEFLTLQWKDLQNNSISVQRAVCWNRKGGGWYFDELKTVKSRRRIPLARLTIDALKAHKVEQNKHRLKAGKAWKNYDLIFTTFEGGPVPLSNINQRHFKPLLIKAKLPDIRVYDLRHTCATLLLLDNVHPKIVQERLGHSSISMTLDTYSHVLPSMQEAASQSLQDSVFSQVGDKWETDEK